eukprot:augustus_masked-scaffold_26-processed-gene-4.10-mRNA-1 protein AED:1.00 eAED:1.00 QI:0/-1/0/0/-1/1/1/0/324
MQISSSSLNRSVQASTEVPEHASLRRRSVSVLSVNVGGLTTFKLNVLRELSRDADVLMLQEVNKQGCKRLEQEVNVSQRAGRWFLSKQPNCSEGVATFLCQELSERVVGVQTPSDRILKVVVSLNGKAQVVLVNCYAPHLGKSADDYKKFLSQLKKVTSKVNKRRLILIGGDLNAQLSRNFKQDDNRYGYSHRSNRNGKMLERWLLQHDYEVVNFKFKTGRKKEKKHATYYQKGNSRIKSEIKISYLEVQDRLNWNPTPPNEPPPEQSQQEENNLSNTPPTPNRISPIAIARTMSRYKRQRQATINPLEYIQTMLAVNESSQNP